MGEVAVKSEGAKKSKYVKSIILVVCILVALIIVNNIVGGKLLTLGNFRVLIQSTTPPALVAWGFCIIFTGNITDLSPGAIVILASSVAGIMSETPLHTGIRKSWRSGKKESRSGFLSSRIF